MGDDATGVGGGLDAGQQVTMRRGRMGTGDMGQVGKG